MDSDSTETDPLTRAMNQHEETTEVVRLTDYPRAKNQNAPPKPTLARTKPPQTPQNETPGAPAEEPKRGARYPLMLSILVLLDASTPTGAPAPEASIIPDYAKFFVNALLTPYNIAPLSSFAESAINAYDAHGAFTLYISAMYILLCGCPLKTGTLCVYIVSKALGFAMMALACRVVTYIAFAAAGVLYG